MKSLLSVCLSACQSVRPESSRGKTQEKICCGPNLGQRGEHCGPETSFFFQFIKFCSLVFHEIAYNNSLQEFLTSIRGKIYEIFFLRKTQENFFGGPTLGQNWLKPDPKLVFLPFSQVWFISFPLNCIG